MVDEEACVRLAQKVAIQAGLMGTNKNLIQPSRLKKVHFRYAWWLLWWEGNSSGAKGAKEMYVAMYDFAAETGEEMSVRKGKKWSL